MNNINILIVDDEQIVIDSIKKHLRNLKQYVIFEANDVNQALEIIEKEKIDMLLTDLMMPEIDGLELLTILNNKKLNIITIMITGYATINTALQAQQLGAFDYLAKPFTKDELLKLINRASSLVSIKSKDLKDNTEKAEDPKAQLQLGLKGIGENSWFMRQDDGLVIIGTERPFVYGMGKLQNVYLPNIGDELRQGSVYFQVFSTDLRTDSLLSPLSGNVKEVNNFVLEKPNEALQDPYEKGWLIKLQPSNFEAEIRILGL